MIKTYKKGQSVKVISTYISLNTPEDIIAEIMFCNNQSLLIRFNQKLYEIPENAIISVVDTPVKQEAILPKPSASKKTATKTKNKKQVVHKNKPVTKATIQPSKSSTKRKKAKHYGNVVTTLVYIPPKTSYYEYSSTRRSDVYYGAAHDRAYWSLTHPYVGGGCCPR